MPAGRVVRGRQADAHSDHGEKEAPLFLGCRLAISPSRQRLALLLGHYVGSSPRHSKEGTWSHASLSFSRSLLPRLSFAHLLPLCNTDSSIARRLQPRIPRFSDRIVRSSMSQQLKPKRANRSYQTFDLDPSPSIAPPPSVVAWRQTEYLADNWESFCINEWHGSRDNTRAASSGRTIGL